jgi:hypothetical protein
VPHLTLSLCKHGNLLFVVWPFTCVHFNVLIYSEFFFVFWRRVTIVVVVNKKVVVAKCNQEGLQGSSAHITNN